MTGTDARKLWECAAESARRQAAKVRTGEVRTGMEFAGMVASLRDLRNALVQVVTVDATGELYDIITEVRALERLARFGPSAPRRDQLLNAAIETGEANH